MTRPRRPIRTDAAPSPRGGYSQAIEVGPWVFTSGTGPRDPATGELAGETVAVQTDQVMRNLAAILGAAGASLADAVRMTVYLADLDRDFADFDAAYRAWWPDTPPPARTTVGAALPGVLVEIDAIAVRSER